MQAVGPALLPTCPLAIPSAHPQDASPAWPLRVVTQGVQHNPDVTCGGLVIASGGVTVDCRGARVVSPVAARRRWTCGSTASCCVAVW